jgi:uncharacterized lipoprotein YajG
VGHKIILTAGNLVMSKLCKLKNGLIQQSDTHKINKFLNLKHVMLMKKLLMIAVLFTLASCVYPNQKVKLNFSSINGGASNIGNGTGIILEVFDDASGSGYIGNKTYCNNQKITIATQQNLAEMLKEKIRDGLYNKGFIQGGDKLITIRISRLKYKAECGFFLGRSEADISVKVLVTNLKTGVKITKNYERFTNNKHFIIPLASTDARIINDLVEEVIEDVLEDNMLFMN